ncbi:hypothetical protein BaRGS_00017115 [Batillaria attramentaria]|uniref:Uncharacterized protein n=1 Tax=Batillaria attramentaria TaxID=370345 RepID=A0ABD0KX32_9CAEN
MAVRESVVNVSEWRATEPLEHKERAHRQAGLLQPLTTPPSDGLSREATPQFSANRPLLGFGVLLLLLLVLLFKDDTEPGNGV